MKKHTSKTAEGGPDIEFNFHTVQIQRVSQDYDPETIQFLFWGLRLSASPEKEWCSLIAYATVPTVKAFLFGLGPALDEMQRRSLLDVAINNCCRISGQHREWHLRSLAASENSGIVRISGTAGGDLSFHADCRGETAAALAFDLQQVLNQIAGRYH